MTSTLSNKKSPFLTLFALTLLLSAFPGNTHAASNTWSMSSPINLSATTIGDYCAEPWCGPPDYDGQLAYVRAGALINLLVTINHSATVKNVTMNITSDAVAMKVGDSISFLPADVSGTDISWTGSGMAQDTPYGSWTSSRAVTCDTTTQIFYGAAPPPLTAKYWGYVNLNIDPVSPIITKGGTAILSCDGSGFNCTVTKAGTITATITWPATSGHFNYKYTKTGHQDDKGDWLPANTCESAVLFDEENIVYTHLYDRLNVIGPTEYVLPVPAQSISFSLTASAAPTVNIHFSLLERIQMFITALFKGDARIGVYGPRVETPA